MAKTGTWHERRSNGEFTYQDFDRLCTCGHPLGRHTAAWPHECIVGDFQDTDCSCNEFKPAPKQRAKGAIVSFYHRSLVSCFVLLVGCGGYSPADDAGNQNESVADAGPRDGAAGLPQHDAQAPFYSPDSGSHDSGQSAGDSGLGGRSDAGTTADTGSIGTTPGCVDADGDGFGVGPTCRGYDCNDNDPTINPGHAEMCDFLDHNCDGQPDSTDIDGDGVRAGSACSPSDCNDHDATVYPGATERCDGIDSNCDGIADNQPDAALDAWCVSTALTPPLGTWSTPPKCGYLLPHISCFGSYYIDRSGSPVVFECWRDTNFRYSC